MCWSCDDGTQQSIQNGQANLNAYVPIAPQFDMHERRDIGLVTFTATPKPNLDLTTTFRTQRHVGELPWGASFGFGNDVEVPLPYNSRANDLTVGAEWTNQTSMLRVAYDGSWFQNHDDTLQWDSPLRLDNSTSAPGLGRMALWPSNTAQTFSFGGYTKFARNTQLTGFMSFGAWSNDAPLLPFTINPRCRHFVLPRETAQADAQVFSMNLNVVSRPVTDWRLSARFRQYSYDNQTPQASIPQFINYDTSVKTSTTGGPETVRAQPHHLQRRRNMDRALAVRAGSRVHAQQQRVRLPHLREHRRERRHVHGRRGGIAVGDVPGSVRDRRPWRLGPRRGASGADRRAASAPPLRPRRTGPASGSPDRSTSCRTSCGCSADRSAWVTDDYDDSYFGLQEASFRITGFSADYQQPGGFGAGASYNYERYAGLQRSRSASPGEQAADPLRDWTADSTERVHYFSIYLTAAADRTGHGGADQLRLVEREHQLCVRHRAGRPSAAPVAAPGRVQQVAGASARRPAPAVEPSRGDGVVSCTSLSACSISRWIRR